MAAEAWGVQLGLRLRGVVPCDPSCTVISYPFDAVSTAIVGFVRVSVSVSLSV